MKAVIYVILVLSFCTKLIQTSCLSYGHSCWGAHGKRSGITSQKADMRTPPDQWTLLKIIPDKNKVFHRERNIHISQDDSLDIIQKANENLLQANKEPDASATIPDDLNDNLLSKQLKRDSTLDPRKNRRKMSLDDDNEPNTIVLTPEEMLDVQNIRLYEMLMNKDRIQNPRKKYV